ncbi:cache domain-containing protein [Oleispirillum naphthae]|uniref:cache domain-containing protein n=1 Tax=Oleispirillum naphthae TaxID=2838853 RepID=UPI003082540E
MRYLRLLIVTVLVGGALLMVSPAHEDLGSPCVAKALAERAAELIKTEGTEKAAAALSDPKSEFVQGSMYVFMMGLDGVMLAHPHNPKLIGRSFMGERDFNGVAYGREMVSTARTDASGWVDYVFTDPVSHKLRRKSTYVLRVGEVFVGCGYYLK